MIRIQGISPNVLTMREGAKYSFGLRYQIQIDIKNEKVRFSGGKYFAAGEGPDFDLNRCYKKNGNFKNKACKRYITLCSEEINNIYVDFYNFLTNNQVEEEDW
jgi:hypothetical protein